MVDMWEDMMLDPKEDVMLGNWKHMVIELVLGYREHMVIELVFDY